MPPSKEKKMKNEEYVVEKILDDEKKKIHMESLSQCIL